MTKKATAKKAAPAETPEPAEAEVTAGETPEAATAEAEAAEVKADDKPAES